MTDEERAADAASELVVTHHKSFSTVHRARHRKVLAILAELQEEVS